MAAQLPNIQVKRHSERGHYDAPTIHSIVDAAWYCHVAAVRHAVPVIIPTLHVRIDNTLYLHGAVAAGIFNDMEKEQPISIAITLMDGIVLARSLYNHSANYRSVVLYGVAHEVTDADEKFRVLHALSDKMALGRWEDARQPNATELKVTRIFGVPLDNASAKIRSGPPKDDPEDMGRDTWAGVLPLETRLGSPQQDPQQENGPRLPEYLKP